MLEAFFVRHLHKKLNIILIYWSEINLLPQERYKNRVYNLTVATRVCSTIDNRKVERLSCNWHQKTVIYLYSNWHTVQASTCQNFITIATIILPATIILIFYLPPHSFLNYQFLNIHFISHFFSLLFPTISNFSMFFFGPSSSWFCSIFRFFFFVHHLIKWSFNVRKVVLKCCFFLWWFVEW